MKDPVWTKSYEKQVPASLNYAPQPLDHFLSESASRWPGQPATLCLGKTLTYGDLDALANRFANLLPTLGLSAGDRVAMMLPNVPQIVFAYYGTLKARCVVVQINPLLSAAEVAYQVKDSGATVLVTLPKFEELCEPLLAAGHLKHLLLTDIGDYASGLLKIVIPLVMKLKGEAGSGKKMTGKVKLAPLLETVSKQTPPIQGKAKDLALIQYTGGTTGLSKGAMLTHANLVANTSQCRAWLHDLREGPGGDIFLGVVPFFHVYGMTTCMNLAVMSGCTMVLLPRFEPEKVASAAAKYKCTIFSGVNLMYSKLNSSKGAAAGKLVSIRACISGAGPLFQDVQEKFELLSGGRVVEGYGLTEASPVLTANTIFGERKVGYIGLPFPDTEVKIVDAKTGKRKMPVGKVGELIARGPQIMKGYWGHPAETKKTIRGGWLYTGDLAVMDKKGFFKMAERKKDMIKSKGENVYPRKVEEAIVRHPAVSDCVVVGLPDKLIGEKIKAYMVAEADACAIKEIEAHCRKELSKFEVPQEYEFRASLPKNIIGKTLRRVLRDEETQKTSVPVSGRKT